MKVLEVLQYNLSDGEVIEKSLGLFFGDHPIDRQKALKCIDDAVRNYKYNYDYDCIGSVYPRWVVQTKYIL